MTRIDLTTRRLGAAAVAFTLTLATGWAQAAAGDGRSDPGDANADVPPVQYQSPLKRFRTLADEQPKSWKDANDNVERIGGWRAYAKEAANPDRPVVPVDGKASEPASSGETKPMPAEHGGHKTN